VRSRETGTAGPSVVCNSSSVPSTTPSRGSTDPTPQTGRTGRGRPDADAETEAFVTALLTASRVLVGVSARSLSEAEDTVTVTQFRTLVVLESNGEINLSGLAEKLGVNASTALRMTDRLHAADLVTRRDHPETRREVLLGLSPAGRRLVRRVTARRRAELARVVDAMPAARRAELLAALRAFAEAAGEAEPLPEEVSTLAWYVDTGPDPATRKQAPGQAGR